ncbi:MAG: GTP cyclohydrolase, FolE2/MptA family [Desulfocapsaceae bacterium]|nr:GTP cyclohydrolase, FolE2/MptA family [Desulfocapsaceae bacterium]
MIDIQSQLDTRRVDIKKVGVKTICYPITLLDKANNRQHTVATVNMYVNLPHRFKGTHMSRFIEILNRFHGQIDLNSVHNILEEMKKRLQAEAAHIEISFPYFLRKIYDSTVLQACRYECQMHGSLKNTDNLELQFIVPISLPVNLQRLASLPYSLGHWGNAVVQVRFRQFVWIEDLIMLVERCILDAQQQNNGSNQDTILSVEGLTGTISEKLLTQREIKWYSVAVENFGEGYSTFAATESGQR